MKAFMDKNTAKKVRLLGKFEELQKLVDLENLPKLYGGTSACLDDPRNLTKEQIQSLKEQIQASKLKESVEPNLLKEQFEQRYVNQTSSEEL